MCRCLFFLLTMLRHPTSLPPVVAKLISERCTMKRRKKINFRFLFFLLKNLLFKLLGQRLTKRIVGIFFPSNGLNIFSHVQDDLGLSKREIRKCMDFFFGFSSLIGETGAARQASEIFKKS